MKGFFGRKKASQENPYAQQQAAQEEYDRMTPYQRARADLADSKQRPNIPGGLPSGPGARRDHNASPAQSTQSFGGSTYVESPNQSYGPNRYGNNQGYGANRYDSNSTAFSSNQSVPSARPSGYGGFEPSEPADTSELYGGARPSDGPNRYARQPQRPQERANRYAAGSQAAGAQEEEENEYDDTELTPEQREEREFRKVRGQIKNEYRSMNDSAGRSLAIAGQIKETASRTLATLGEQGERLNRVDQSLNMSAVHARNAEAKTKELQALNRSMFAVRLENPVGKKKRMAAQEQAIIEQSRRDRDEREEGRSDAYQQRQHLEQTFERNQKHKYHMSDDEASEDDGDFEKDEEDRQASSQLKGTLTELGATLGDALILAKAQNQQIRMQNNTIDRISDKTDGVTDHVVKNSAKLRTFK